MHNGPGEANPNISKNKSKVQYLNFPKGAFISGQMAI